MLNYIPKYEVLCSSNATWQYQGKGGFGWLEGPCRARGGWERQLEPGGPVVMAREQGNGLGSAVRCFWIFYLLVPNPNRRRKMCINALMGVRLHRRREDKFVPPADPSPSQTEQALVLVLLQKHL